MVRYLILYNIRSSHNVGSLFRTADGAGVHTVYLAGYTPAPIDRFGRPVAEIHKTSLGASSMVAWERVADMAQLCLELRAAGVTIVAIEQSSQSVSVYEYEAPPHVAYILGNEITGVPGDVLALCDAVVEIPMAGQKESLNVSVAGGIVLFHHPYAAVE